MKEIKVGDVYFENEILKVVYVNGYYFDHFMYEIDFLGHISKYSCSKESIDETIKKRLEAYALIPDGCKVIPCHLVGLFKGKLIGGILEDSVKRVYGLCDNGIRGFSCSVFYYGDEDFLNPMIDYSSIVGDFNIKK